MPERAAGPPLARYDAQYRRQLHRWLLALERVQRRRQGEDVPPPVDVSVTVSNGPSGPDPPA